MDDWMLDALMIELDLDEGEAGGVEFLGKWYGDGEVYSYGGKKYVIFDNVAYIEDAIVEYVEELIKDGSIDWDSVNGIERFLFGEDIDFLSERMLEYNKSSARDWMDQEPVFDEGKISKLHEEMVEMGLIEDSYGLLGNGSYDKNEVNDLLWDKMDEFILEMDDYENPVKWFEEIFGNDYLSELLKSREIILDIEGLTKEIIKDEGREFISIDNKERTVQVNGVPFYIYEIE